MNKKQTLRAAEIMSKFDEPNWFIEVRDWPSCGSKNEWSRFDNPCGSLFWNWICKEYRAIRIEKEETKTPLSIDFYKIGMEICTKEKKEIGIVYREPEFPYIPFITKDMRFFVVLCGNIASWRWPKDNGDGAGWNKAYKMTTQEVVVEKIEIDN